MASITFTIPDPKLPLVVSAIKHQQAVPTDADGAPLFTDNQWAKEFLRRKIRAIVLNYQQSVATDAVLPDDDIAT